MSDEAADGTVLRRYWLRDETPRFADPADDAFGVVEVVDRLVPLIAAAEPPFTLALSGSWGAGKTTIARELRARLPKVGVPCCDVDLWIENLSQLRRTLVIEVGAAIDSDTDKDAVRTKIAKKLDQASRVAVAKQLPPDIEVSDLALKDNTHAIYAIGVGTVVIATFAFLVYAIIRDTPLIPVASALFTPAAIFAAIRSGLVVRISNAVATEEPAEAQVATQQEFRSIVAAPEGATAKPVLVIVDNLDRLPAGDAVKALREIRSFMEIPRSRCVFLVPIDRSAFVRSLEPQLQGEARDYLEKFFNLDIALTLPEPIDLRDWARKLLESVFVGEKIEDRQFYDVAQLLVTGAGGSPRAIKRLINAISTRYQLLTADRRKTLTLSQLAFAEVLAIRFPMLIETLAREASQFLDSRQRLLEVPNRTPRDDFGWMFRGGESDQGARDELVRLLLATSDVALSVDDLRDILSARVDRFWIGIAEPSRVVETLASGDPATVGALLSALEPDARARTLYRMVDYTTRSTTSRYYGNAITYANALAPLCTDEGVHVDQLREATQIALFETNEGDGLGRLAPRTIDLIFSGREGLGRAPGLWRQAERAIDGNMNLSDAAMAAIVVCVRQGAAHVSASERRDAQSRLAKAPIAALDPLFNPPVVGDLVNGFLADLYASTLATDWDIATDLTAPAVMAARLRIAHDHGWANTNVVPQLAARAIQQLPRVTTLTPAARTIFASLMPIFATSGQPTADQVASALVGWTAGTNQVEALTWALSLPRSGTAEATTKARVETWLATAPVADIEMLLKGSRDQLLGAGVAIAVPLLARWIAGEDAAIGLLGVQNRTPSEDAALVNALAGAPAAQYIAKLQIAASWSAVLTAEDLTGLVAQLAAKLAALPYKDLDDGEAVDALRAAGADVGPLAEPVTVRVGAADAVALTWWAPIIDALRFASPDHEPQLRAALAARSAALGSLSLAPAAWLFAAERPEDGDALLNAYCQRIRQPETKWDALAQSLQETRPLLRNVPSVQAALVARAHAEVDCAAVKVILTEAARWDEVRGSARSEFDSQLTAIATRCSEATNEVVALRTTHEDRRDEKAEADAAAGPPTQ